VDGEVGVASLNRGESEEVLRWWGGELCEEAVGAMVLGWWVVRRVVG